MKARTKTKAISKGILAALVFSLLSAGVSNGAVAEGNVRMSRTERADAVSSRRSTSRKTDTFRTEKTDSWLCINVSAFFCTSMFPTLSSSEPPKNSAVPARGRN
jgi:hypothetical protein